MSGFKLNHIIKEATGVSERQNNAWNLSPVEMKDKDQSLRF